jgi:hypothetical protein
LPFINNTPERVSEDFPPITYYPYLYWHCCTHFGDFNDFSGLAGLGFIPAGFFGFFGFNPLLAQTTNLGFFKNGA